MSQSRWTNSIKSTMKTVKWCPLVNTENSQMLSIIAIFTSTCHTKQIIYCQTHQPFVWWIAASCVLVKGRGSHIKTTQALLDVWQASETSHSKSSLGNLQHQYLPDHEFLVNVYSYHLMEKNVSCCCVRGRWIFSNSVTIDVLI